MHDDECPTAQVWTNLSEGGELVIPLSIREALDVKPGDRLLIELHGDELHVLTVGAGIRRAGEIVRRYIPAGVSLVDELIADRRAEFAKEEAETAEMMARHRGE
ncbi:MAG: AbrB/MazE/SpoVT family DNA-binding domain-containing protein [Dehalococcoidia bacterium]